MNLSKIDDTLKKVYEQESPAIEDLLALLSTEDAEAISFILAFADKVRRQFAGDDVHVRGIIEFSNYCRNKCLYCGLNRGNTSLMRYRLSKERILDMLHQPGAERIKTIVLQSGEDDSIDAEWLTGLIRDIKKKTDIAVTLSVGERKEEDYALWRQSGADRFLLKHETANPVLYARLHPGDTLDERIAALRKLRDLGYQIGSGNIIGLPGQTARDLAWDIVLMNDLDIDMAGIGPFIPHPQTSVFEEIPGNLAMTLKVLALTRIVLKDVHIPATTAIGTIHPLGREIALSSGANVIMVNITPDEYTHLYSIYPGRVGLGGTIDKRIKEVESIIKSCRRKIASDKGDSLKLCKRHLKA